MKEQPILFSDHMVRAILSGQKSQTRRLFKLPRGCSWYSGLGGEREGWVQDDEGPNWWHVDETRCPFGRPGDRLWVRECFAIEDAILNEPPFDDGRPVLHGDGDIDPAWRQPHYRATDPAPDLMCMKATCSCCRKHGKGPHWRPSIFMPRWASRITLEITDVRVERLNDISIGDCIAEGIARGDPENADGIERREYSELWEQINGAGAWASNPWVWAVSFRRI